MRIRVLLCLVALSLLPVFHDSAAGLQQQQEALAGLPGHLLQQEGKEDFPFGLAVITSENGGYVNIREGADAESAVLLKVWPGAVAGCRSDPKAAWVQVQLGKQTGYVNSRFLYTGQDVSSVVSRVRVLRLQQDLTAKQVALLELPDEKALQLAQLAPGQAVLAVGFLKDWVLVQVGSQTGYLRTQDVGKLSEPLPDLPQGQRDYQAAFALAGGLAGTALLKEEEFGIYTAFVSLAASRAEVEEAGISGFLLYLNGVLQTRLQLLPDRPGTDPQATPFAAEFVFAHPLGQIVLLPLYQADRVDFSGLISLTPSEE